MAVMIFAVASLLCFAPTQAAKSTPPPGMDSIPGGQTWIGTERAELEKAAADNAARFMNMANETPQFQRNVESFYLGVTEVTNEQFAEFVKGTGSRPPDSWGLKAIDEAAQKYVLEIGQKRNAAREAGKPMPEFPPFDQAHWWNDNWKGAQWEIPAGQETLPAAYIDYVEAERYAQWAGARLMSEFEFQRAARGSSKSSYPWGDKWDPQLCANAGLGLKGAKPVGSYPGGKSAQGVFDFSGNVWEWTSSPFVEYPGFKVVKVRRENKTLDGLVDWNVQQRVMVGGSFANEGPSAARINTRRPTDPKQSADAVGFRIAASQAIGTDVATAVLHWTADQVPAEAKYDENRPVICDRWRTLPGTSQVPGYSVIAGYDFVVFVPAIGLDFTSLGQMEQASLDKGPIPLGVLATNQALLSPALPAGNYAIGLRGPGPLKSHESIRSEESVAKSGAAANSVVYPEGFKPEARNLLFYDKQRQIVAAQHLDAAEFVVPTHTSVEIASGELEVVEDGKPSQVKTSTVLLRVNSWVKVSNKGLGYAIAFSDLALAPFTPSNTARSAGAVFPVIVSIPALYGSVPGTSSRRIGAYLMWVAFATTCVTSSMFVTALAPNLLALELVRKGTGLEITWAEWFVGFAPIGVPLLLTLPWLVYKIYPPEIRTSAEVPRWAAQELARLGPITRRETAMAFLVTAALGLWVAGGRIIDPTMVALLAIAVMIVLGVVSWSDIVGNTPAWNVLVWFATLVVLADGLNKVGVVDWLGRGASVLLADRSPLLAMALLVTMLFLLHYMIAGLAAHTTALLPVFLAAGASMPGIPIRPYALLLVFSLGLMGVITPYACGPAAAYYSSGYVPRRDFWRLGLVFGFIFLEGLVLVGVPYLTRLAV